jgi:hypothetical protein
MKQVRIVITIVLALVFTLPLRAASYPPQSPGKQPAGKIMGVLLDVNYARVSRAEIRIESAKRGMFSWKGESDEAGEFTAELPAGTYQIYVRANGFRRFESAFFKVRPEVTEMIDINLEVGAIIDTIPVRSKSRKSSKPVGRRSRTTGSTGSI